MVYPCNQKQDSPHEKSTDKQKPSRHTDTSNIHTRASICRHKHLLWQYAHLPFLISLTFSSAKLSCSATCNAQVAAQTFYMVACRPKTLNGHLAAQQHFEPQCYGLQQDHTPAGDVRHGWICSGMLSSLCRLVCQACHQCWTFKVTWHPQTENGR